MNAIDFESEEFLGQLVSADWIADLESSDSRLHKEHVIEKALVAATLGSSNAQCFLYNCYLAYNPFFVYNVRQIPETQGLIGQPNPWTRFWALCRDLRTRGITGHRARDAIQECAEEFDSQEWNTVCRRVLIKDLRCGISEKTLNKVLGKTDWKIPVFTCQLATDSTDRPAKMKGIKRLECKLDGVRVLAVVSGSSCTLFSRSGKEFSNFPQIADAILANRKAFQYGRGTLRHYVLDGEIVGESFQKLMKQAHRKSDVETSGMVYHIFDIVPLDSFKEGHCNLQQHKRLEWLESARNTLMETDCLRIMNGLDVDLDTAQGHDIMTRYAQDAVHNGFEGIMIKELQAPYECKRSSSWMKWKPTISVDLTIVGFEEGTGRNAGRVGAIVCKGIDNDRVICVNVGGGFSDLDRDEYWVARDQLLGHLVEIEADAVTQNQDGTHSLRFPRFLRFRDFDSGAKV
jgi:DNA ligase-1